MQTVYDGVSKRKFTIAEVHPPFDGRLVPVCTTEDGRLFECVKVEGKDWDYESL